MLDLIQIKSLLDKKNIKEDVEYIGKFLQRTVNENNKDDFSIKKEVVDLSKSTHTHYNYELLSKINEIDVLRWNAKYSNVKRNISEYINDMNLVSNSKFQTYLGSCDSSKNRLKVIYNEYDNIIINSLTKEKVKLTIDDDGCLITEKI